MPMTEEFRVSAVQMDVRLGEKAANLERMDGFARQAAGEGAGLVVFPECVLAGYCFESREEGFEYAESIHGPAVESVTSICRELDLQVVFGLLESDGEKLYNALALVGPGGLLGSYRKAHLPHLGIDHYVDPGDNLSTVHETPLCRLGMNICYDGAFPESARLLALAGADLVVLPTNWPPGAEEFAGYAINTRAMENAVYYLAADRVGEERGFRFIGLSRICDVHGRNLALADGESETVLTATIDPAQARRKRIDRVPGKHWIDRFADRRPDLYGPLAWENPVTKE